MKKLSEIFQRIDELQSQIDSNGTLDKELQNRINYKFRLDWNYFSNAMEGNSLTRIETKQLMMDNVTIDGKSFKDVSEMRGHDDIVQEIFRIGKGDVRISEKRIKEMHKAIMHEDDPEKKGFIGKWKTSNNHLINYKNEKFYFLDHSEVPDAMHELINRTNADIDALKNSKKESKHPVLIASQFHLDYVRIHPFYDGNGRTARLLTNLLLISFGYPPFLLSEKSRDSYNRILAEIQGYGGDRNDFHSLIGSLLIESQELVLDAIAGKDISEDDDIDKEILLFKQNLSKGSSEVLEKSNLTISRAYMNSIKPLFELFIQKHASFIDLFLSFEVHNLLGEQWWEVDDLEYFDTWASLVLDKDQDKNASKLSVLFKRKATDKFDFSGVGKLDRFRLELRFFTFRKGGTNIFDVTSSIEVAFNEYSYELNLGEQKVNSLNKLYSEELSSEEMMKIVNAKTKGFLESLKAKVE